MENGIWWNGRKPEKRSNFDNLFSMILFATYTHAHAHIALGNDKNFHEN